MLVRDCLKLLKQNSYRLTRKQLLVLRGQILAGDTEGALKGLKTILGGNCV